MRSPFIIHHLDSFILSDTQLISLPDWGIHGAIAKWSDDRDQAKVECSTGALEPRGRAR
jgi:hypothetical protein